jgi:hypothetical protein
MKKESKNHRSLDVIAEEIHKHQRVDMFVVGALLNEAWEACEYGDWGQWLYDNFAWSEDTAERYRNVAKLVAKIPLLRNLKLARVTLYALTQENADLLPAILDALVKAGAAERQLKPHEAAEIILLVRLRREHGDLPDAVLRAIDEWCQPGVEARDEIIAALKREKPTTKEAADKIVARETAKYLNARLAAAKPRPQTGWLEARVQSGAITPEPCVAPPREGAGGPSEESVAPSAPSPEAELLAALKILLHLAQRPPLPIITGTDVSSVDVMEIIDFLGALHRAMNSANKAKIAADRAEARSRKTGGAP